ncbi:MAG: tetraacyldisaccharide 4'-kinase [Alphaproteobacteria bacterium]
MRAPEFWYHDGLAARLLTPVGQAYALAGVLRWRLVRPWRSQARILCVGNAVAGGAGKTPVAIDLAARLNARGAAVHILGAGYGGRLRGPVRVDPARHRAREVGDQALLLARVAPTWIARDRRAGVAAARAAGAEVIVLDDGLQDPSVAKDASLLVIDAEVGFGNGRVIPAGPLREPAGRALARADAVALVGSGATRPQGDVPVFTASLEPTIELLDLADRPVLAFAGIGRPGRFFAMLERLGLTVARRHAFPDHHAYDEDTVMRLVEEAAVLGARPVTTEKDFVRLAEDARPMVTPIPVAIAWDDTAAVEAWLDRIVPR